MRNIEIRRTHRQDTDFIALVRLLDADLWSRYATEQSKFAPHNQLDENVKVVVAMESSRAVGCGALRSMAGGQQVEIKRMFVHSDYRGRGVSKVILQALEDWAAELGFTQVVLETGNKQAEALGLYKKAGYLQTENYGPYCDIPESICMAKSLTLNNE